MNKFWVESVEGGAWIDGWWAVYGWPELPVKWVAMIGKQEMQLPSQLARLRSRRLDFPTSRTRGGFPIAYSFSWAARVKSSSTQLRNRCLRRVDCWQLSVLFGWKLFSVSAIWDGGIILRIY